MSMWSAPPGGFTAGQLQQRRRRRLQVLGHMAAISVLVLSSAAVGSYRWVTRVRPVEQSQALDLFRAAQVKVAAAEAPRSARTKETSRRDGAGADKPIAATGRPTQAGSPADYEVSIRSGRPKSRVASGRRPKDGPRPHASRRPAEGVYSWATKGHEQVGGARREFPAETQRIISFDDETWTQHHYFSEERQIWSAFQAGPGGIEVRQQRNKVTFGPVTKESQIDFTPPMLVAPKAHDVGFAWSGDWSGATYGDYAGKVFERSVMEVGGERVRVWGMTLVINLHGEQEGRVEAEVWFAPGRALTVREHYVQDVDSGGARYHAEWTQTLQSLQPRQ